MRTAVLVLGVFVVAATSQSDEVRDREPLQGIWKITSVEQQGKKDENALAGLVLVFSGDKLGLRRADKDDKEQFRFIVDPTSTPKAIDIYKSTDDGKRGEKLFEGIYSVDGAELQICFVPQPGPPWERPASLEANEGSKGVLVTLKRID
jgi:uncharacterized protein (TIGR03067 family)